MPGHAWQRFHRHPEHDTMRGKVISEAPRVLDVSHSGPIAVLRMGHGKVNALDVELCGHITSRLEELGTSSVRAVVLTGQAGIFSAGVDLVRALDGGAAYLRDFLPVLRKLFDVVFFYPRPVVAAINGHAIAGGCVLACAADQRLMARGPGRIGVTELLVGLPFPAIALEIMRFTAVPGYFREVIFGAGRYPAEAAATRGLVDAVVDPEALLASAVDAAQSLASLSPAAFALTKSQTRQPVLDQLQKYGDVFDAAVDEIWLAPQTGSRIRDYVSRTFKKI
jgi:enoyl-CoA hydratase